MCNVQGASLKAVALFHLEQFSTPGRQGQSKPWRLFFRLEKKLGEIMLISDFITQEERARFDAMPEGVEKRAVARHFETELLRRLGYLHGEQAAATAGWRLFPDDAPSTKAATVVKASFSK